MERKSSGPIFFTERSLADYLAVSDRTIRNWIRRGELPSSKLGAARRIDPADVEDFSLGTDEVCDLNPFKGVRIRANDPRAKKKPRPIRVFTFEEMHQLREGGRSLRGDGPRLHRHRHETR